MDHDFDLIAYLEDRRIDYGKEGSKDVGKGWVGINCPFPMCSDHAHHCGINRKSKRFKCYLCGKTGWIIDLISVIERCSTTDAWKVIKEFSLLNPEEEDQPRRRFVPISGKKQIIPPEATKDFPPLHRRYLESRGFDPDKLIREYQLYAAYNIGGYRGRIIAPHFLDRRIVAFTARDVTGSEGVIKYLDIPEEEAIVPVKHTFYNIDSVQEYGKGVIVEGITDVWRMDSGFIASCTSSMTDEQKVMIARKKLKRLFVMYDADAEGKARSLAREMNIIVPTELILLDEGDPADLSPDEARMIRRDLLG